MTEREAHDQPRSAQPEPYRVRLPGFINEQNVGLGDAIKKATAMVGLKPCGGCQRRAARLNQLLVFSGRRR
jgi:hypothetical protein